MRGFRVSIMGEDPPDLGNRVQPKRPATRPVERQGRSK